MSNLAGWDSRSGSHESLIILENRNGMLRFLPVLHALHIEIDRSEVNILRPNSADFTLATQTIYINVSAHGSK